MPTTSIEKNIYPIHNTVLQLDYHGYVNLGKQYSWILSNPWQQAPE